MRPPDRAKGALYGLGIGDALGMPTQMLSRRQIVERWGPLLTGFEAAPHDHPIAAGMPAGAVTDDTEQAALLGWLLVEGKGRVSPGEVAAALLGWEREMAARGSLDLLGPSTKRALDAVANGTPPAEAGKHGDTNGAAMRITPVGIVAAAGQPAGPGRSGTAGEHRDPQHVRRAGGRRRRGRRGQRGHRRRGYRGGDGNGHRGRRAGRAARALDGGRGRRGPHPLGGGPGGRRGDRSGRPRSSTRSSAPAWPPRSPCRPPSPCSARCPATPGRPACWPRRWAATATRSPRWPGAIGGACHGLAAFPARAIETVDGNGLRIAELAEALFALRSPR